MKVAVLLSGGVDSSVALKLLQKKGCDITAFYLKIWLEDEMSFMGGCPWEEDLKYVREVCNKEKIPLKIVPMQKEYFDTVVKYTIEEVKKGRTPNPDIMCNNNIKFGLFINKISESFDKVATGHYAQVVKKTGKYYLKRSPDKIKDQTYFLSRLSQKQLARADFPIGHLNKKQVRKYAEKFDLPNKNRKDSQGICFLGKLKYSDFLKHYLGEKKGDILEYETGKKMGEHAGTYYYTIGQRKGILLAGGPWYVVEKDLKKNIVFISKNYHDKNKKRNEFEISDYNFFSGKLPSNTKLPTTQKIGLLHSSLKVKLRHGEKMYIAKITKINSKRAKVKINKNDQGIAKGQFAVFYRDDICLGSAVID